VKGRRIVSYKYVIDTYAWVEYFKGSEEGKKAQPYIEGNESATSVFAVAELAEKYEKEEKELEEDLQFMMSKTKFVEVTLEIAKRAGVINANNKKKIKDWGMADAIIFATAQSIGARVVTGDQHFKDLNALMIA